MAKGTMPEDISEKPPSVDEDLYTILGVESSATPEAIKTAYKKNALRYHPGMPQFHHVLKIYLTPSRQGERGCSRRSP